MILKMLEKRWPVFLGKDDANDFTGYTLRRTGATEAVESDLTTSELMLLVNWKS
jgi:hypothetical protein